MDKYSYYFHSPSWELVSRRKLLAFLDEELVRWEKNDEKRTERTIRSDAIQQKLHFMENVFPLIEKYTKESERKREKSKGEITVEESKHLNLNTHLKQLQMEFNYLLIIKENLLKRLAHFKIVRDYLNNVCAESQGQFQSIPDLLDKFNFLLHVRHSQIAKNQKLLADIELGRKTLAKLAQEATKMELEQQDKLVETRRRKSQVESQVQHLEDTFDKLKNAIITSMVESTQLQSGIYNLYSQSIEKFGRPSETRSSGISQQARFIQDVFEHIGEAQGNPKLLSPEPSSLLPETEAGKLSKSRTRTHTPRKSSSPSDQAN